MQWNLRAEIYNDWSQNIPFTLQVEMLNTTDSLFKTNKQNHNSHLNLIRYVSFLSACWY